mgnify:FL=1
MLLSKKALGAILVICISAAILVLFMPTISKDLSKIAKIENISNPNEQKPKPVEKMVSANQISSIYKINTECEMIYGLSKGTYPDGSRMPHITLTDLMAKYPEKFAPWKGILENNQTRTEFLKKPLTPEFSNTMTSSIMNYSAINPGLEPIVELMIKSNGKQQLQEYYLAYNCKQYFDQRSKQ